MGLELDEVQRMMDENEIEEEQKFIEHTRKIDFRKKKCTGMKTKRRVFLLLARPIKEECILQTKEDVWMEEWRRYERESCRKSRSQEHHQLTKDKAMGRQGSSKGLIIVKRFGCDED